MKIALFIAAALAVAPAFSAQGSGHGGHASSSRHGRAGFSARRSRSSATALPHSATHAPLSGTGAQANAVAAGGGFHGRAGLNRFSPSGGATGATGATTPCGPGCTAGPSVPGSPGPTLAGTISHTVAYSNAAPGTTQTVSAGAIEQNPNTALDVRGGPGVTWAAHPDTLPGGNGAVGGAGAAGGNGGAINQ